MPLRICKQKKSLSKTMICTLIIQVLLWSTVFAEDINTIRLPILNMPIFDWQPLASGQKSATPAGRLELAKKIAPIHLADKNPGTYSIVTLYDSKIVDIYYDIAKDYISPFSDPAIVRDINYYWSVVIPQSDIQGTNLTGYESRNFKFGRVQELMLNKITEKMFIDLSKVALRLGVPERDLSYSYDPAKWEDIVHAMVDEGIVQYLRYLDISNEENLASLFDITKTQLRNATIDAFIGYLPPILPKKHVMGNNKTQDILTFLGISANSSDANVYKLIQLTTNLTSIQFSVLYNLTIVQRAATERSTLLQMSQSCGIDMPHILGKTIPRIIWDTVGDSKARSVHCWTIFKTKGVPIQSLTGLTDQTSKTALQILLYACDQYWKSCRFTMSLEPSEWECIDSHTLSSAASIISISEAQLLASPVNDFVEGMTAKCKSGDISLSRYRMKYQGKLEELFNLTLNQVQTLNGISNAQGFTAPQLLEEFLNASAKDFGISLDTMYNTSTKTLQQLFDSPIYEIYESVPFILRSAVSFPASELQMTVTDTLSVLNLFAENSTIAQYRYAATYVLPFIISSKKKFENNTIGNLLATSSISDGTVLVNSTLGVLLDLSRFNLDRMKTLYGMNDAQISVLTSLKIKDLDKYCGFNLAAIKTLTPFNLTALLVGIKTIQATCVASRFYVAAIHKQVQELEVIFPIVSSTSMSLLQMARNCTSLTWRYNARVLGVQMKDWPEMDVLNRDDLASYSQLSVGSIKTSTFVILLTTANQIEANEQSYQQELATYSSPMRTKLYDTFNTNNEEVAKILGITTAYLDSLKLLQTVEKVQDFLKAKYTINLSATATSLNVLLGDLKYLAPTEWQEMVPTLKTEITSSGSSQLAVTEGNFNQLLQINDISTLPFGTLKQKWDTDFKRLLNGKLFSENKTISEIQSMMGINLESLHKITVLALYNNHLNLSESEISVLYGMPLHDIDVLSKFTFSELPCSCKISESNLLAMTPFALLSSMVGKNDLDSCRPIAILDAMRSYSIKAIETKFNTTLSETEPLLDAVQDLSDLPYEKISWGLNIMNLDWSLFSAVSIKVFANATSKNISTLKAIPFRNVTQQFEVSKDKFTAQLQALHASLLAQASNTFSVSSSDACGQCAIPSSDILKTFLNRLGKVIYLDPIIIPPVEDFKCITHDLFKLQPTKWNQLIPGIIPQSFKNISNILNTTEAKMEYILGLSRSTIFNMTLQNYIQLVSGRILPMVTCYKSIHTDIVWTKVSSAGKDASYMKTRSVLDIISLVCSSDVDTNNMSVVMGWEDVKNSILQNTTMEDAALCEIKSIKRILSINVVELAGMILSKIYGCVVQPCRSGTVRDQEYYNCSDINECKNSVSTCQSDQFCQNFFGGHQCECTTPGYCLNGNSCSKCKRFLLKITFEMPFAQDLANPTSLAYYNLKEKVQELVIQSLKGIVQVILCRVDSFSKGSTVADMSVYTTTGYDGSSNDLQKYFDTNLNKSNGNTYLGDMQIKASSLTDYNECSRNQVNCHQYATCENKEGTFSCKCNSGYDGDGIKCEAGFLKTYWWLVILLAVILLIIIIVIILLIVKKPRLKSYGVDEELPPMKRTGSNLSYKNGDVFYKDKQGNVREGTQHAEDTAIEHRNPIYGKEIPENVYDNSDSQWSKNIYALDNLGADDPKDETIEMKSRLEEEKEKPVENGLNDNMF